MKLMHFASALALAVGMAATASAQGTPPQGPPPQGGPPPNGGAHGGRMGAGGMRRGGMDAMLFKGITLTDAQKDSLKKLNTAQEAQMKAMWESMKGKRPDDADRKKMRELREAQAAQFRAVLTKEQQPIYDKNVAEMKAVMQQHMKNRKGDAPPPPQ
jgi:Spy/CpxP family protein refolding chaperone